MAFNILKKSIVWDITLKGKRFRIFTGMTTDHWIESEQRVSKVEDFAWEKNEVLEKLEREAYRLKLKAKVEGIVPNKEFLEQLVQGLRGNPDQKKYHAEVSVTYAWQWIDQYQERMKNTHQVGHLKNFKSLGKLFKESFPLFRFAQMSEAWMIKWVDHLLDEEELLHNTIVRKLKELRAVAEFARRHGEPVHAESMIFRMKERRYHPFFLDWELHVSLIESVELANESLQKIRDRFIFRCYTGMREGEIEQIQPNHLSSKAGRVYLKYMDQKGKKPKTIQIPPKALDILKRYGMTIPAFSQQKENDLIKKVCEMAGLKDQVEKVRHAGNRVITEKVPLHDLVTTHTARRTFARRWYEQGGDLLKLSKFLGHSSIAVTERYVGVEDDETMDEMMRIFA